MVQDTITESSEDEEEDVGSKKNNNKATRVLPSQNVDATSVLLSTETEGDVKGKPIMIHRFRLLPEVA